MDFPHTAMTRQDYYPRAIANQPGWLRNFAHTLNQCRGRLDLRDEFVDDAIADALWLAYVVGPYRTAARRFGPASTRAIEEVQTGKGAAALALTNWVLPPVPEGVVPRPPGALKRIFKLVVVIKRSPGYDESLGLQLGILSPKDTTAHPVPTFKIRVAAGDANQKVLIRYSRHGHPGVFIQCQVNDGDWDAGIIAMRSLHVDTRPLRVPGQPELRRYRLRYWDGQPYGDWTDVVTVTVGP